MKAPPPIGFECRSSTGLIVATVVVLVLALLAVWLSGLPHWAQLALSLLALAAGIRAVTGLLHPRVRSLSWRTDGSADIRLRDSVLDEGREVQGTVQGGRVLGPLIVLALRWPPRGRASVWLLPDNLDADTRRRLRMRLGAGQGAGASGNADTG